MCSCAPFRSWWGDSDEDVREAAFKSTAGLPEFRTAQEKALAEDSARDVRIAAANALDAQKNTQSVKALVAAARRR